MAGSQGSAHLTPDVLRLLEKETGLGDAQAWSNILSLVSKGEHDSLTWWLVEGKDSVYGWSKALPWDWSKNTDGGGRGLTIGIVGFTTHHEAKPEGDAQVLFKEYVALGGKDFRPLSQDCAKDKAACKKLSAELKKVGTDPVWIKAQWQCLVAKGGSGYVYEAMQICKKHGIDTPGALTIAALFDCALNHGATGPYGARALADKVPTDLSEREFLKKFLDLRLPEAGKHGLANPPINGTRRVGHFMELLKEGHMDLKDDAAIKKATSWIMK